MLFSCVLSAQNSTFVHVLRTVSTDEFLIGRTEVTQEEFEKVTGKNPSHYRGGARPVDSVSWFDAVDYLNRRSELEGFSACYALPEGTRRPGCTGYRLPTSAEWAVAAGPPDESAFRGTGYQDESNLLKKEQIGTAPASAGKPNPHGLYGMSGNVWEWCEDWFSRDPKAPTPPLARVIRGGSFMTGGTQWNKELLSSMEPHKRSRFTGFRAVRAVTPAAVRLTRTVDEIRKLWTGVLGVPKLPVRAPGATLVRPVTDAAWTGQLLDLEIDPGFPTRILVAAPAAKPAGRLPVILVPYYDVDTPVGADLGGRRFVPGATRAYARLAVQRGFLAVAVKWYGEADGEGYDEAVFYLNQRHPGVTPLGKWAFDLQRIVDYLGTRDDVDMTRIGMIGHSLGGKMALYGAAFEPRVRAVVSSEPGISLSFSNYGDFWYLGNAIKRLPKDADQHELLALIAPRPFLLIAGESADGAKSLPYLLAVKGLYPNPDHIAMFNHATGHSPTEESVEHAMAWLARFLR